MGYEYTAIIHLREPATRGLGGFLEPLLRPVRGVRDVRYEPVDRLVTVRFEDGTTSLAELVRALEDAGCPVSGVAQRTSLVAAQSRAS